MKITTEYEQNLLATANEFAKNWPLKNAEEYALAKRLAEELEPLHNDGNPSAAYLRGFMLGMCRKYDEQL